MVGKVTVTECPFCGAPIDRASINPDDPKCRYCERPLPTVQDPPPAPTPTPPPVFVVERSTGSSRRSPAGRIILLVVVVAILGIVAAVIGLASSSGSKALSTARGLGGSSSKIGTIDAAVAVSGDAAQNEVFAIAPNRGSSTVVVRRIDLGRGKVVWSSPDLGKTDLSKALVAGPASVYAVVGTNVYAYDAATGTQQWQAALSFGLAYPCAGGCAALVSGHLVTLSKDGTVQSFDAATGRQAWSTRMKSTPRFLQAAGSVVAVDDTTDRSSDHVLVLFDPATGAARTIAPVCDKDRSTPFPPAKPESELDWFISPDGSVVTVVMATIDGCAMQYRIADGALMWKDPPQIDQANQLPGSWSAGGQTAASATTIVWPVDTTGQTVYALDRATGKIRALFSDDRVRYEGRGIVGGVVVLEATPSFDSSHPTTVAVDLATGRRLWQLGFQGSSGPSSQQILVTPTGVIVASCDSQADVCTFKGIDPTGGAILGTTQLKTSFTQLGDALPTAQGLLVTAGFTVAVLDPKTAAVKARFGS